jgi:hypothetical protein
MAIKWDKDVPDNIRSKLEVLFDTEIEGLIEEEGTDYNKAGFITMPLSHLIGEVDVRDPGDGKKIIFWANNRKGDSKFGTEYNTGRIIHTILQLYPSLFWAYNIKDRAMWIDLDDAVNMVIHSPESPVIINDTSLPLFERRTIVVVADDASPKIRGINYYTMTKAKELFKFPPNHPVAGTAYAMIDVYPDHYIPLSGFHEHYKQTKHAAFIELCASLGAKEICIESAEINNQTLDINADIKTPLSSLGLGINVRENRETGQKIAFKFSEDNKEIKDFDSPWLYTEPSWLSMNNLRRKNHLQELGAEFTCVDDMGINANLSAHLKVVGVNIGGNFQEMTKIRLSYSVIFW